MRRAKQSLALKMSRLEQVNSPPFVDPETRHLQSEGLLRAPHASGLPVPMLQLAIRRFAQDEARVE